MVSLFLKVCVRTFRQAIQLNFPILSSGWLDDVDHSDFFFLCKQIKGELPLGNVLEFYGGNDSKMRNEADFVKVEDD